MNTKERIIKAAKICYIISKVLYILSFVTFGVFAALAVILPLTGAIKAITAAEVAVIFVTLALHSFLMIGLLWNLQCIFRNITEAKTPFSERVSHYLKKIFAFVALLAVVPAIVGTTIIKIVSPGSELVFPMSIEGIIIAVVLFILRMFFSYGNELQNSEDETL